MINQSTTLEDLAAIVSDTLTAAGINAVLSGGAVVSIYSENEFHSYDLDFVTARAASEIADALAPLGFLRGKGRHFEHPRTRYLVEFPAAPVMAGNQPVERYAEHATAQGIIRLLTPTDAVKDRLAAFFHWSDRQALEQALSIVRHQAVDLRDIEKWARKEPSPQAKERLSIFLQRVAAIIPAARK